MEHQGRLLLVDDEPEITGFLQMLLDDKFYVTHTAASADEALGIVESNEIDILITDIRMPGKNGIELMAEAKKKKPDLQCMILTGHGDLENVREAMRLGAIDFIRKPIRFEEVERAVLEGMSRIQLINELKIKQEKLEEANKQLCAAKNEADVANLTKSEFLANMSHEIRTPLNGVLGMTELLFTTGLTAKQQELAEMLCTAGKSLLDLVNDFLDISKIESGKLELESMDFNLRDLVKEIITQMTPSAMAKGVSLSCDIENHVYSMVRGDFKRISQIFLNLVSNGVKYTNEGSVEIKVRIESEDTASILLHCAINDTGIGIVPEAQDKIFDAFSQADSSITRRFGGTGLGLSIVQHLVAMMGGEVGLKSEPGTGSTFWFTARLEKVKNQDMSENMITETIEQFAYFDKSFAEKKILLVEDNFINQQVALELLKLYGCEVVVAGDGREALQYFVQDSHFDLVLMDCHMPEMDGFTATAEIRKKERQAAIKHVPIVAMTARAMNGDREKCFEAGMDDYLSKPFSKKSLLAVLVRRLKNTGDEGKCEERSSQNQTPVVDYKILADLRELQKNGKPSLFIKLVHYFLKEAPCAFSDLARAIDKRDTEALSSRAHKFKSSCMNMGVMGLGQQCDNLERLANEGTLQQADQILTTMQKEYQEVHPLLRNELEKYTMTDRVKS